MNFFVLALFLASQLPQFRHGEIAALASDPKQQVVVIDVTLTEHGYEYLCVPAHTIFSEPVVEDTQSSLDQARQLLAEGR